MIGYKINSLVSLSGGELPATRCALEALRGPLRRFEALRLFPPYHFPKIALEALWRGFTGIRERHPMELLIRHAEPNDLEAIRALYAEPNVVAGTLQVPFPSLELWRKRLSDLEPAVRMLVAVADGTVVGHLGIHPAYRPRRAHAAALGMAVHDAWAG